MTYSSRSRAGGGTQTFPGAFVLGPPWFWSGVISPVVLPNGATNNWAPTDFANANVVRCTVDALGSTLNGLAGGETDRAVVLINSAGGGSLVLAHQAAGSLAANRFDCPGAVDLTLAVNSATLLWYDGIDGHWHVFAWS